MKKRPKRLSYDEFIRHADNVVIMDKCAAAIAEMSQAVEHLDSFLTDRRLKTRLPDHEHANLAIVLQRLRVDLSYVRQRYNERIKRVGKRSDVLRLADIRALHAERRVQHDEAFQDGPW